LIAWDDSSLGNIRLPRLEKGKDTLLVMYLCHWQTIADYRQWTGYDDTPHLTHVYSLGIKKEQLEYIFPDTFESSSFLRRSETCCLVFLMKTYKDV
jgi:hypothetical protein